MPGQSKFCMLSTSQATKFTVVDADSSATVFTGTLKPRDGDFGRYAIGSFSGLTTPGRYQIQAAGLSSVTFSIDENAYLDSIHNGIAYFSVQRCGNSSTGYHAPCHLDDGRRLDTGAHQDVAGGWHDACDLRKWVDATIYGMVGLTRLLDYFPESPADRNTLLDELRWGNLYFRNMQEPAGYVMNYCGGDDGNYFTDNVVGSGDDRPIHTEPVGLPAQFHFIASQAALARALQDQQPAYAHGCLAAAQRCYQWMIGNRTPTAAGTFAAGIMASAQLYRTTQDAAYRTQGAAYARQLLALQEQKATPLGFFYKQVSDSDPHRDAQNGNLPLLGLCDALETFPDHPDAAAWQAALTRHCNYLLEMADRSGFGIVPYGLYQANPGGNRRVGDFWYRWFMEVSGAPDIEQFWVGINANLASNGIGLSRAATLLKNPSYASLAQRQLDWILGCNPFSASTVIGAGFNQPTLYRTSAFKPNTPLINGAVMNGIGGTNSDLPDLADGTYHTCEYWTPMVAYTTWLMAELQGPIAN